MLLSLRGRDGSVLSLHPSSCSTRHHTALPLCHLSANLIPVTSSPSCPHHHRAPTWPHSYPTASPPVHPHSPHPHTIPTTSVPFFPHHLSPFTGISPQWSITTSVPISSPSPQLCAVPTTSMPPFVPPQPHAVIVFPTSSHPSPQPHTAPVPAPIPTHSWFTPLTSTPQCPHYLSSILSPQYPHSVHPLIIPATSAPSCPHHLSPVTLPPSFTLITHNHLNTHPGRTASPPILSPSPRPHVAPFSRPPHSASHSPPPPPAEAPKRPPTLSPALPPPPLADP